MRELFMHINDSVSRGERVILVTVIGTAGVTPREPGARMLVDRQGLVAGTIGGGAVEGRCIEIAGELLRSPFPQRRTLSLAQEDAGMPDMACGGQVTVHFLPLAGGDEQVLALCREAEEIFAVGSPLWLLTPLEEGELTLTQEPSLPTVPARISIDGRPWLLQQISHPGRVYIFGGGHVAQALVPVLGPLGFFCVVLEDRPAFAIPERFPQAQEVRQIQFDHLERQVTLTENDYVCILTRDHDSSLLVQRQVLRTPVRYIGVLGSKKKAQGAAAVLRNMGFSPKDLERIVTPIGLPLGGQTPAEIAVSIAAQLIQYRAGKQG